MEAPEIIAASSTISRIVLDGETRAIVDAIQARTRTTSPSAAIALMIGRYGRHLLETWELSPEQFQPSAAFQPRSISLNGAQGHAIEALQAKFAQIAAMAQSNADLEQSLAARAQSLADIQRAMQALAEQDAMEQGKQDALRLEALRLQAMESVLLGKFQD